ncbi:hypothetical protein E2320_019300, partial [Naja naja]
MGISVPEAASSASKCLHCTAIHWIAKWNVRGMSQGKLDIAKQETIRLEIDWSEKGFFQSEDFTDYYSGHDTRKTNGVAFIVSKKFTRAVEAFSTVSDQIMTIRIHAKPLNITIMNKSIIIF